MWGFLLLFKQHNTPLSLPLPPPKPENKLAVELQLQLPLKAKVPGKREGGENPGPFPSFPTPSNALGEGSGAERSPPNLEMPDKAAAWQRIRTIKSFN